MDFLRTHGGSFGLFEYVDTQSSTVQEDSLATAVAGGFHVFHPGCPGIWAKILAQTILGVLELTSIRLGGSNH